MASTIFEIHYRISEVSALLKRNTFSFRGLCTTGKKPTNRYLLNIFFHNLIDNVQASPNQNHDSSIFSA